MNRLAFLALAMIIAPSAQAKKTTATDSPVKLRAELGFVAIVDHKIQFGKEGTAFDYIKEGGQDNLFDFLRLSVEVPLSDRHELVFLAQPLLLESFVRVPVRADGSPTRFEDVSFPGGTPMRVVYDFGFWRGSYLYHTVNTPKHQVSFGLSLQLRNATIEFSSEDGTLLSSNRDIGPVPIIKARWNHEMNNGFQGIELDGFYAPVSYLNGDDNDVVGAILDASYRIGRHIAPEAIAFLNLRYLGGGAEGISDDNLEQNQANGFDDDGFTANWLHTMSITLGFGYDF